MHAQALAQLLSGWWTVPPVWEDGNPPALHLAEAGVRKLDVQGQLRNPDGHFQWGLEHVVAKGDPGIHRAAGLLSTHKHIVAAAGNLRRRSRTSGHSLLCMSLWGGAWEDQENYWRERQSLRLEKKEGSVTSIYPCGHSTLQRFPWRGLGAFAL